MTSVSIKERCIIVVLGENQRKVVFSGGMDQLLFALKRELKDLLKPDDRISHLMEYDKDMGDYIDLRDRIPEEKSKIKVVLKKQEKDDFMLHVEDLRGFKMEKVLSEELESAASTNCCEAMSSSSSTPNFLAYYSDSDISKQVQDKKEQITALLKTKVIAQKFREDIILRLADVDQRLEEYIKQLAKKRDCLCLKVETVFNIIGPFGIIDQFRNELLDHALKMNQVMSPDWKVIAAIAAVTRWKQLAGYLGIPLETAIPPSASMATEEDSVFAVLKKWAGTDPQIPWQKLAFELGKAGRSDLAHLIQQQCTTPTGPTADDPGASGYTSNGANRNITGLSPDVLYLMKKLPEGDIEGVAYDQLDKGCVAIWGLSTGEVDSTIGKFQSVYQNIADKVKVEVVQCPSTLDLASVNKVVENLNRQHKQCVLLQPVGTNAVRIVSCVPRQFEQVKVQLQELLKQLSKPSGVPASAVPVCSSDNDSPLEVSMELKSHRRLTLKRSEIIKEKVQALVSEVRCDLQCTGRVAGAIDAASLNEVQTKLDEHFKKKKGKIADDVVATVGGGTLLCSHVCHVIEPESTDPVQCQAWLGKAVSDVLNWGEKTKIKSVAIPDLSAGGLSKAIVAQVMITTILKHTFKCIKTSTMADIRIVVSDDATYACFAHYFAQLKNESAATLPGAGLPSGDGAASTATSSEGSGVHSGLPALESHGLSYGGSTNQPIAPVIEQPVHMRPLSSRRSSGSQKTSSSKHASHTGGPQGLLPPLASRRPVEMERSAVGALVKQEGPLWSKSAPNGDQSAFSSSNSDMDTGSLDKCSICLGPLQSPTQTACGHTFCSKCFDRATAQGTHPLCPMCKTPITQTYQVCPICLSNATDPVTTICCKQMYCRTCLSDSLKASPYCPTCKRVVRKLMGDQPPGTMAITQYRWSLAGYEGCGTIVITYNIPDGIQGLEHPNPGTHFHGTTRSAYLPDNAEGREVLALLQKAWEARMVFTVGTSVTTGLSNCVVWNNIHHKTSPSSGPYGYPDVTYLKRVKQELASRGITLEDGDAATV